MLRQRRSGKKKMSRVRRSYLRSRVTGVAGGGVVALQEESLESRVRRRSRVTGVSRYRRSRRRSLALFPLSSY